MANIMDLVRELKVLNGRRKRGESLSEAENTRRKELKVYLKTVLAKQKSKGASLADKPPVIDGPPTSIVAAPVIVKPAPAPAIVPAVPEVPVESAAPYSSGPAPEEAVPAAREVSVSKGVKLGEMDFAPNSYKYAKALDISEAQAASDRVARAQQQRSRATGFDAVRAQLAEVEPRSGYSRASFDVVSEQYYESYCDDGYAYVLDEHVDLAPIDPRQLELDQLGLGESVEVPRGLAFLDDYRILYTSGILPPADEKVEIDSKDPGLLIPGRRKVTLHMLDGTIRRGTVMRLGKNEAGFVLDDGDNKTEISLQQIKALFVHQKGPPKKARGTPITVTFHDRRSIKGNSTDYQPGLPVFSLVPVSANQKYERIIVNAAAALSVQ